MPRRKKLGRNIFEARIVPSYEPPTDEVKTSLDGELSYEELLE